MPRSPGRRIRLATLAGGLKAVREPGRARLTSAGLTPATGARTTRFCRTRPAHRQAAPGHVHVRRDIDEDRKQPRSSARRDRSKSFLNGPAALRHLSRPTLPRPPHPAPTFVTMANAPHEEQDTADKPVIWVK